MRKILFPVFIAFAFALSACANAPVDTPSKRIALAKAVYTETVTLMTAAAKTGKIPDKVIVEQLEPARAASRASLDLASKMLEINSPDVEKYVQAAVDNAQNFKTIYTNVASAAGVQ